MTRELAKRIADELTGATIAGWTLLRYRGHGGTAVVLEAECGAQKAAVKLYDKEFIEESKGGETEHRERLERQLLLRGHDHPHLVPILDAGKCSTTGYLYLIMGLVDQPSLRDVLSDVPRARIRDIISQVASAAMYLEQLKLVHRDIKPENIAITTDFVKATLLDLGVVRPLIGETVTDGGSKPPFLGTPRYAPQEFFHRREGHSLEDWRAITFYQLGGVLHDLIMRRPLFGEFSRSDGTLVHAIDNETPRIQADDVPPDLILLAKDCLQKDPKLRNKFVTWDRFDLSQRPVSEDSATERLRERLSERRFSPARNLGDQSAIKARQMAQASRALEIGLDGLIRNTCVGDSAFPPVEIYSYQPSASSVQVCVHFTYANRTDDRVYVCISFLANVLDAASVACEISAVACVSSAPLDNLPSPPQIRKVFEGTFDVAPLQGNIDSEVFQLVDLALDRAESAPGATSGPWQVWLTSVPRPSTPGALQ